MRARTWSPASRGSDPRSPSSPCTEPPARTARSRNCSRSWRFPTPARGSRPAAARWTRRRRRRSFARPASRPRTGCRSAPRHSASSVRPRPWTRSSPGLASPSSSSLPVAAHRWGSDSRPRGTTSPRRSSPRSATTIACCWSATSMGGSCRSRSWTARPCRSWRSAPRRRTSTATRRDTRSGAPSSSAPPSWTLACGRRSRASPRGPGTRSGARASPGSTSCSRTAGPR